MTLALATDNLADDAAQLYRETTDLAATAEALARRVRQLVTDADRARDQARQQERGLHALHAECSQLRQRLAAAEQALTDARPDAEVTR